MRRAGLEDVEIGIAPADGVTQAASGRCRWRGTLKWARWRSSSRSSGGAADAGRLSEGSQLDRACGAVRRQPGGVVTEVVLADRQHRRRTSRANWSSGQRGSKAALAEAGALGMISENTENRELADERGWVNSFGDNGWSFTKGSSPLVCFSITPRGSQLLRGLLQKGPVKVRANVDSRYYAGVYPYVTGVIRGSDGAERRGGPVAGSSLRAGRARQCHRRRVDHRRGRDGEPPDQGGQAAAAETHHPRARDGRMLRHDLLPRAQRGSRETHRGRDVHRFTGGTAKSRRDGAHVDSQSALREVVRGCAGAAPGGGVLPDRWAGHGLRWSIAARPTTISAIRPSGFPP